MDNSKKRKREEKDTERQRGRLRDQEKVGIKMHEVGKPEVNITSQRETNEDVHKETFIVNCSYRQSVM